MLKTLTSKQKIIIIFLFALFLRTYKLNLLPIGFHADEVRVAWNALSIQQTGKDDRGNRFALYYNTFGDYRPSGIFYLTIPSIMIFGKNEFAVRFPSALLGSLTVIPIYLITQLLTKDSKKRNYYSLLSSFFLAISPWHISTSRATSEVIISSFFAILGLYFFLYAIYLPNSKKKIYLFSFLSLSLSYFFYHSIRILAPLLLGTTFLYFIKKVFHTQKLKPSIAVLISIFALTILFSLQNNARERFSQVSIFSDLDVKHELSRMPFEEGPNKVFIARLFHNKLFTYSRKFIDEYTKYFSSEFFITNVAKPGRYSTVNTGLLTYLEFFIFIAGVIAIIKKTNLSLPIFLLFVSPFAAALTTEDSPNLHRSLLMIFFIVIIESFGYVYLTQNKLTRKIIFSLLIINFVYYLHMYYTHAKYYLAEGRNEGAKELALFINESKNNYDKILLTNIPDDLYPWLGFFGDYDPTSFNQSAIKRKDGVWEYNQIVFTSQRCPSRDAFEKPLGDFRLLVVDASGCATESNLKNRSDVKIIKEVKLPNEAINYTLWSYSK